MKTSFTLILLGALLILAELKTTNAQWVQQSAIPIERSLNSAYFITPNHGFITGENNLLMETMDGGLNWSLVMNGSSGSDPLYKVAFADATIGFLTGNNGISQDIYRTTNGGQTWNKLTNFPPGGSWRLIDFVSPGKVLFGGNGACVYTADNGNTFTLRSVIPDCPIMYGMDFRNEKVGLVAGNSLSGTNGIFLTNDSGVTWQQKFSGPANDVLWLNDTIALAAGGAEIYRTTDGGNSWNVFASGILTGLLQLEAADANTILGVSGKGDVWRSANAGQSWTWVFDGLGDLPVQWSIHFSDNMNGWVVGQGGFIYKTTDGGLTWAQVCNGVGVQLTGLEFLDNNYGLAVGENGYIFRTTNGGNWWEVQKVEVTGQIFGRDESLHGVSIVDADFAAVAGPGGTVFKTEDGGFSWQNIGYPNLPGLFWIEDVKFIDHNFGWVVGLDQDLGHTKTVYKTLDGGQTWILVMNQGGYMYAMDFTDSLHGWIVTTGGLTLRTTDGGISWQQIFLPPYFMTPTISDINFLNQNVGWIVGWDGLVAHTTDGGVTWAYQNIGTVDDHLFSVRVVSPTEVWISGRNANLPMDGVVYHSIDGGVTWIQETIGPNPYWGYSIALSPNYVWIAGTQGRIYRNGLLTDIEDTQTLPDLDLISYPNPITDVTTLRYSLSHSGFVSLNIYDILGNEVASIINEKQEMGNHEVKWNTKELSRGIYFCRLKSGNINQTIKLVLQ